MRQQTGREPAANAKFPNKRAVRITVVIPSQDRALKSWLPWARKRLAPEWLNTLTEGGGGKAKAETWFIYRGTIQPARFKVVEIRDGDGGWRPATADELKPGLDGFLQEAIEKARANQARCRGVDDLKGAD